MFKLKASQSFNGRNKWVPKKGQFEGLNRRRASALVPVRESGPQDQTSLDAQTGNPRLLLKIEAEQRSCYLAITCERERSRAGVIVFRGRVLACIYGQDKLRSHLVGRPAYEHASVRLMSEGTLVNVLTLEDEVALATASLFLGNAIQLPKGANLVDTFKLCLDEFVRSSRSGCVVINNKDSWPVCGIYLLAGRTIGIYSSIDGWLPIAESSVPNCVATHGGESISGHFIEARNFNEASKLTFSLSGLGDRKKEKWEAEEGYWNSEFVLPQLDGLLLRQEFSTTRGRAALRRSEIAQSALDDKDNTK